MTKLVNELEQIERYHLKLAFPLLCSLILLFLVVSTVREDERITNETHRSLSILLEPILVSGDLISIYRTIHSFESTNKHLTICLKDAKDALLYGKKCSNSFRKLNFKLFNNEYYLSVHTQPLKQILLQMTFLLSCMVIIFFTWRKVRNLIEVLQNDLKKINTSEDTILSDEFLKLKRGIKENQQLKEKLINTENERKHSQELRKIAHDLRSPVSVLEYIIDDIDIQDQKKSLVKSASDNIIHICSSLLLKSRKHSSVYLPDLIENVIRFKVLEYRELNLKIEQSHIPEVHLDNDLASNLECILSNIMNNSVDARKEKIAPHILTKASFYKDKLHIEISDNGTGLNKDSNKNLFVKNFTTKEKGNGIGLFEAKSFLKSIGGDIELKSNIQGTKAILVLPADLFRTGKPYPEHQNYSDSSQHKDVVLH